MKRALFAAAALAALALPASAAAPQMKPGEWEMTVETAGLPGQPPQKMIDKSCITPEQVSERGFADRFAGLAELEKQGLKCTRKNESMSASGYKGEVTCPMPGGAPGTMTMKMDGRYGSGGTTLDMTMNMTMSGMEGQPPMTIVTKVKGRHLGECTAETRKKMEALQKELGAPTD